MESLLDIQVNIYSRFSLLNVRNFLFRGSNKSTAINLIERATREIERYLQIKIEDSRMNGSVTVESLLNELEKKRSIIQYVYKENFSIFQCI